MQRHDVTGSSTGKIHHKAHLKNCKRFLLFVMEDSDLAIPASSGKQALVLPDADVCNTLLFDLQRSLQGELLSRQVQAEAVYLVVSSCTNSTCKNFQDLRWGFGELFVSSVCKPE